jgi:hypothetical protein
MQHRDLEFIRELEADLQTFVLDLIPTERVLELIPIEKRLQGISPEERMRGLSPEELAAGLSEEQAERLRELLERRHSE